MRRFWKTLGLVAGSSVYLMQLDCTTTEHGFSVFTSIWSQVAPYLGL